MLKSITFKQDYRCFKKGQSFQFEPLTLLVGDQGSGKSTLLQLLSGNNTKILDIDADPISTRSFDYEQDNPRKKPDVYTTLDIAVRMVSHGQFVRQLNESICDQPGVCWLQDEPDASLSIRSCFKLAENFKTAIANKSQVIAAVHAQALIEQFPRVLSIEHRKWMTSQ
jgi:predicted ATPase